nr:hypothetical protein [Tanacetum cinerariifolium]
NLLWKRLTLKNPLWQRLALMYPLWKRLELKEFTMKHVVLEDYVSSEKMPNRVMVRKMNQHLLIESSSKMMKE